MLPQKPLTSKVKMRGLEGINQILVIMLVLHILCECFDEDGTEIFPSSRVAELRDNFFSDFTKLLR